MDLRELEAAGVYDPESPRAAERLALVEWLASRGITMEQMARAARDGQMVALAGDLVLQPTPRFTLDDLATEVGMPPETLRAVHLAVGLPPVQPGEVAFTDDDAVLFRVSAAGSVLFGQAAILRFSHTVGAALSRIAEAAVALYLQSAEAPLREAKAPEVALAQRNLGAIESLDGVELMLRTVFRAHMATATRRQRRARQGRHAASLDTLHMTVGFVDLVGFTPLARGVSSRELATLIDRFEDAAYDVVAARDGRLVKLIGDEMMFVAVDAAAACDIALTLIERFAGDPAVTPRGALATGDLLYRGGDYYGPTVNLAARVAQLAVPGELLVTPEVAAAAPAAPLRFEAAGKRMLKGFDAPVALLTVARA